MDPTDYSNLAYAMTSETPEQRARRLYARNLQQQGTSMAPVQSPFRAMRPHRRQASSPSLATPVNTLLRALPLLDQTKATRP